MSHFWLYEFHSLWPYIIHILSLKKLRAEVPLTGTKTFTHSKAYQKQRYYTVYFLKNYIRDEHYQTRRAAKNDHISVLFLCCSFILIVILTFCTVITHGPYKPDGYRFLYEPQSRFTVLHRPIFSGQKFQHLTPTDTTCWQRYSDTI